ncbi:hypothetical protein JBL43_15990 [Aureibaculum sp. A20]|uniref:ApeA N-terminal domain-containing protein n=1 Tax=Aureibaculum flavum TaxID=2795986 RepID=A0ABS0WUU2_9FLAO|nr:hypothetical protein [Aureibaculum flavum]MBJ2175755.1 hypothetical protein [Aureibaculum flavum]
MEKDYFLLEDGKKRIETKFSENGWLTIYESNSEDIDDQSTVFCTLISNKKLEETEDKYSWPFLMGSEGKPSVFGDNSYKVNAEEGIEPFIFYRSFNLPEKYVTYFDISEEFILYFNLYEKAKDKKNRKFYFIDELGHLDEVLIVEPKSIKVKLRYLKEYITLKEMHFVVCFEFMRLSTELPTEWKITNIDKTTKSSNHTYNHLIRHVSEKKQSWILGKVFIHPNKEKKSHFDFGDSKNEEFIIGFDNDGEEILEDCSETDGNHFKVTYFKKEVLNKYYNEPTIYDVDGFSVGCKYFRLKIDNNVKDYVPVFLTNLRVLPHKEQLHWKQYNIQPQNNMNISGTYYKTMIEGNWAEHPETADLFFKSKYEEFNKKWEKKFGWRLYKPLSEKDKYLFTSLHKITTNNVKAFCEQTHTVVKLTIERLNEKELVRNIDSGVKGSIAKFEKFLESNSMVIPDLFEFLRNLQSLRSGLIAHSFSDSNKECRKALKYFEITDENYADVLEEIFVKSFYTFNTLEKHFKLDE